MKQQCASRLKPMIYATINWFVDNSSPFILVIRNWRVSVIRKHIFCDYLLSVC